MYVLNFHAKCILPVLELSSPVFWISILVCVVDNAGRQQAPSGEPKHHVSVRHQAGGVQGRLCSFAYSAALHIHVGLGVNAVIRSTDTKVKYSITPCSFTELQCEISDSHMVPFTHATLLQRTMLCPCVRVSITSWCFIETDERIELDFSNFPIFVPPCVLTVYVCSLHLRMFCQPLLTAGLET